MKPLSIIFCVGALLGTAILPAHSKPVGISQRDANGNDDKGVALCGDDKDCRGPYLVGAVSKRRDTTSLLWVRGSGEGAAGEGAAGEGADGEGADGEGAESGGVQGGGAQGQGAQGEGAAQGDSGSDQSDGNSDIPPDQLRSGSDIPSDVWAGSDADGSLPQRSDDDLSLKESANDSSPESQEILPMSQYVTNGQKYYDDMMKAIHLIPKVERPYPAYTDRYRLTSATRSPLDPDPAEVDSQVSEHTPALLYIEPLTSPPEIGIDLRAGDWTYRMLTAKGQDLPAGGDIEDHATIVTYGSASQKAIIVTKSDSVTNDIAADASNGDKIPNSELVFQLLQQQAGDAVAETRFIIRHAITQKGAIVVIEAAHASKGITGDAMGAFTADDLDVFKSLLGTRNGRPGVFMATDHPTAMNCRVVIRIFTWAQIPGDAAHGAMVMELGPLGSC